MLHPSTACAGIASVACIVFLYFFDFYSSNALLQSLPLSYLVGSQRISFAHIFGAGGCKKVRGCNQVVC